MNITSGGHSFNAHCLHIDVSHFRASGALGSRLTGAGWGGCTVSLVPSDKVEAFVKAITDGYYSKRPELQSRLSQALFVTQPGGGAAIYSA